MYPDSLGKLADRISAVTGDDLPPWVDAVSLAGSYARGEQDEYSDLDVFFLLSNDGTISVPAAAEYLTDWFGPVPLRRGPVFVPHFGHSMTFILADLSVCQLNINTWDSIEINPMRATSRIVLDRSGCLTSVVEKSKNLHVEISDVYCEHYGYFWIRALYAWRSARRRELWRAVDYLADMRKSMQQVMRIQGGVYSAVTGPYHPAKRFEQHLGAALSQVLEISLPGYSAESITACIRDSVEWFAEATEENQNFCVETKVRNIADAIRREIRGTA